MYLKRKHHRKHLVQVPVPENTASGVSESIGWNLRQKGPRPASWRSGFVFGPKDRSGLHSCCYLSTQHKAAVMAHKGTRWVILADSAETPPLPSKSDATLQGHLLSAPIDPRPTQDHTLIFPESLVLQIELFWFHTFQSLFKIQDKQMTVAAWGHRSFEKCLHSQHPNFEF